MRRTETNGNKAFYGSNRNGETKSLCCLLVRLWLFMTRRNILFFRDGYHLFRKLICDLTGCLCVSRDFIFTVPFRDALQLAINPSRTGNGLSTQVKKCSKFKELNCDKHFSLISEDWKKTNRRAKSTKLHIRRKKMVVFVIKSFVGIVPIKLSFNSSSLSFYITDY